MGRDDQLADLLLRWEEHVERGEDVPPEQLCQDCPALRPALEVGIAALKRVAWVNQPVCDSPELAPGYFSAGSAEALPGTPALPPLAGRYRLDRLLGEGGYGQVWLGFDLELQRPIAAKVPHRRLVSHPEDAAAYLAEARTAAKLDHPHIVPVFDVGKDEHCPCFIVAKLISGSNLQLRLRQVRPAPREAAALLAPLAEALHYAHSQGVVHRDIKPGNLLLDGAGKPYVTDFGLALREQEAGQGPSYAGTLAYMSPEQVGGEADRVDGRSDVFSLGVVFYELLTGRLPFAAASAADLLRQIMAAEPRPPRQLDGAIPAELERICLKALTKRVAERYATAGDLAQDLRDFLIESKGRNSFGASLVNVFRRTTVAAVVLAVALGGLAWWQRPPYAERQLSQGLAEYRQRNYAQAVDAFNTALTAQPDLAGGHFARARAFQRARQWAQAIADYDKVREPALRGQSNACIAYCLIRDRHHKAAEPYHERALVEGVAPAVIYNNRAYVYLYLKRFKEAGENLDRALALAPGMQAAWHNRALWVRAVTLKPIPSEPDGPIPEEIPQAVRAILAEQLEAAKRALEAARPALARGLEAAERALALGSASGELHVDVARLMALAHRDPDWAEQALTHLEAAVQQGYHPGLWKDVAELRDLRKHPRWLALVAQPATGPQPSTPRLVDPVAD
jgi:tetratricopeptide (TPR) repeat protein